MALIKSHSNYVLKKKHQTVSDGTIFERDITTIGGVNQFARGQVPIFRDNNFIITVRNDGNITNQYNTSKWKEVSNNSTLWTLQTISAITSEFDDQNDTKIVLKQDYYDFCDFAYYGSLSELFRSSITDILARFPGELYGSEDNVYYTEVKVVDGERVETEKVLGGDTKYKEIKNPFGIDIYSIKLPVGASPLKYFAEDGYKNYTINGGELYFYTGEIENTCVKPGDRIGYVFVNDNATVGGYQIYIYAGNNGSVYYLYDSSIRNTILKGVHIRPKEAYLADFYNGCDNFQKLLMNPETTPKYKATFSVIKEDEYGYHREMKSFIFPTSAGGYNIDASSYGFNNYTNDLSAIGELYDERFTDNLWRAMTHEAIKNFDWTYTREYDYGEGEEFVLGGQKMQKALRIFAREFDEIKSYIDSITSVNRVTYDERNNIPNYFLTDVCEDDGWDVIQVIPFDVTLSGNICNANKYVQNTKKTVKPYNSIMEVVIPKDEGTETIDLKNGYFISCCSGDGKSISDILCEYVVDGADKKDYKYYVKTTGTDKNIYSEGCTGRLKNRIKSFSDTNKSYTYMDVNNEFLRRLKLNSRYIWRHKGTIEGIEMILAMFGLKSKRWYEKQESCSYKKARNVCNSTGKITQIKDGSGNVCYWDYEVKEYTRFAAGISDPWDTCHNMHKYDWANSTKNITYDYRTVSAYNSIGAMGITYIPYQGLPVGYVDGSGNARKLYPKFNSDEQYDGNPYFQMNGGWLSKKITKGTTKHNFQFDVDNTPVYNSTEILYKETIRNIRRVETIHELIGIPSSELNENSICYVERLDKDMIIVDGEAFDIKKDSAGKEFITLTRVNGMMKIGDKYFDTNITVYGSDGEQHTYSIADKLDGYPVHAYLKNRTTFACYYDNYSIDLYNIFRANSSGSYTNYFILNNPDFSNSIAISSGDLGWNRIKTTDSVYKKINTILNYYKGNNPHSGGMNYDNGEEYYEYFKHIFKYAYENELFDERCYNSYYTEIDNIYTGASFSIGSDTEDKKIHYFGNWKNSGGTIYTYGSDSYSFINTGNPYTTQLKTDSVTNQIINNKRFTIKFNIGYPYNTTDKNGQAKLKFIDEIVMNYLTQMIPSSTIVDVEYEFTSVPTNDEIKACC